MCQGKRSKFLYRMGTVIESIFTTEDLSADELLCIH